MEIQVAFNIATAIAGALGGWLVKTIYESIKELRVADAEIHDRITRVSDSLPSTYVRRDDFGVFAERIEATLARIESKLDGKVDK